MEIGIKIKQMRKQNNVTQRQLADVLCVTSQAISKWENGHTLPDIYQIATMAKQFGVSVDEMLEVGSVAK